MPHDVAAALSMLHRLTQLAGSQLSLHTLRGGEAQRKWLEEEDYEEGQLELPDAPVPQHLTRLVLQGGHNPARGLQPPERPAELELTPALLLCLEAGGHGPQLPHAAPGAHVAGGQLP